MLRLIGPDAEHSQPAHQPASQLARLPASPVCIAPAATHPWLPEVDAAHQLAHDEDVHALHNLALQRRAVRELQQQQQISQ